MNQNSKAFLDMLAFSEGTIGTHDDGYAELVGGHAFEAYDDHPRARIHVGGGLWSTAAGRYQIVVETYDEFKTKLGLKDFSPTSQDAIALALVAARGAEDDLAQGKLARVIALTNSVWASLPGSRYGQPTKTYGDLLTRYLAAGGSVYPVATQVASN